MLRVLYYEIFGEVEIKRKKKLRSREVDKRNLPRRSCEHALALPAACFQHKTVNRHASVPALNERTKTVASPAKQCKPVCRLTKSRGEARAASPGLFVSLPMLIRMPVSLHWHCRHEFGKWTEESSLQ